MRREPPRICFWWVAVLLTAVSGIAHGAAPNGSWWDASYPHRYQINIAAGSKPLAAGYAVVLTSFNHASEVANGHSLASGNDVRIVRWNGSSWNEVDRVLDPQSGWNTSAPRIWLRTQAAIAAQATDDDYYVYFGHAGAGSPPANANQVFSFFDAFAGTSLDAALWTNNGGSTVSGGVLTLPVGRSATTQASFGIDTIWEARVRLPSSLPGGGSKFFYYWTAKGGSPWLGFYANTTDHYARATGSGTTQVAIAEGDTTVFQTFSFAREGTALARFWIDGAEVAQVNSNLPGGSLSAYLFNDANGARTMEYDWVRVRPYRNPEPTVTLNQPNAAHFVITHDGAGVNCAPETVSVSVRDINDNPLTSYSEAMTITTQSHRGTWSLVSGTGSLNNVGDGAATYQWVSGQSTAVFALSYPEGARVLDIDAFESNNVGIRDDDTEGSLTFAQSEFVVTSMALSNNQSAPFPAFASPHTAGTAFPIHIAKYGTTANNPTCHLVTDYQGTKSLAIWHAYANPGSGSLPLAITSGNGTVNTSTTEGATTLNVTFVNGQAQLSGVYRDVGLISFAVKDAYEASLTPSVDTRGGSGNFVVRPAYFSVDAAGNPGAVDANGNVFGTAGDPFAVTVTARESGGGATPNFGHESTPETVTLVPTVVQPAAGSNGAVNGSFGAFTNGVASSNDIHWSEVGIVRFTGRIGDGDYLGTGNIAGIASGNIGRFKPADFIVAMQSGSFGPSCGTFSYVGQPLKYSSNLLLTVTARNRQGATTANYGHSFFKLSNGSVTGRTYSLLDGTAITHVNAPTNEWNINALNDGTATLTFTTGAGANDGLTIAKTMPRAPFLAQIQLQFDLLDSDHVAASTTPVVIGTGTGIPFTDPQQRYGRLAFRSAIGSERVNLPMPLRVEYYYDDATGFRTSTDGTCTISPTLTFSDYAGHLQAGEVSIASFDSPPPLGDFNLVLSAPGEGNDGRVKVQAGVPAWLQIWNPASSQFIEPWGIATFGLFQGSSKRVYQREMY